MPRPADFNRPTIITLSSIPPRLPHIGPVLRSLLAQDLPAQAIHLYIPMRYHRFPDWDGAIPEFPAGITLHRVQTDHGPATKILPALRHLAGHPVDILYCDDDCLFSPGWHRAFKIAAQTRPRHCIAAMGFDLRSLAKAPRPEHRLPRPSRWNTADLAQWLAAHPAPLPDEIPHHRSSGFADIAMGHGGVLVQPDWFAQTVFDIPDESWAVDDIWLSGHLETRGIPIWVDHDIPFPRTIRPIHHIRPLMTEATNGLSRDAANQASVRYFRQTSGIWAAPQRQDDADLRTHAKHPARTPPGNTPWHTHLRRALRAMFKGQ